MKKKENILNTLRGIVFLKLKENEKDEKLQAIFEVLKNDDCFSDLTVNAAYDILKYLNITDDEISLIYAILLSEDNNELKDTYLIDISNQKEIGKIGKEEKEILDTLYKLYEKKKQEIDTMNDIDKIKMIFLKYYLSPDNKSNPFVGLSYNFISDFFNFLGVEEKNYNYYFLKLSKTKELIIPISKIEKKEIV